MTLPNTITDGRAQRDAMLASVRGKYPVERSTAQRAMLSAMRSREDLSGTSDDATERGVKYQGNAPWLGAAVRQLSEHGLIVRIGNEVSRRPSRHCNEIKRWRLTDPRKADAAIERLSRILAVLEAPAPASLFAAIERQVTQ